ncbi:ATP synthase f chain, mitochondrial precursor [Dipsacomyces acuminosporus]|nr:ATP synthase f chain, mitochondrial precursor [Dipsacomyces acuminosporus]
MSAVLGRALLKRTTALRNYSSLREIIPPNIGFAARAGESTTEAASSTVTASAQDVNKVVSFYRNLPKGNAEVQAARGGPLSRYYARYIGGDNASGAPIAHVIGVLLVGGYSIHYFMHLKHHKSAEHH